MNQPDLSMTESSTSEADLVFLDAFDDIGSLDILSLNLSRDGLDTDGHKVLGSAFEIILTVIYACLAITGLISNTALMGIILGELKFALCGGRDTQQEYLPRNKSKLQFTFIFH